MFRSIKSAPGAKRPARDVPPIFEPSMREILRARVEELFDRAKSLRAKAGRVEDEAEEIERQVGQILSITDELP